MKIAILLLEFLYFVLAPQTLAIGFETENAYDSVRTFSLEQRSQTLRIYVDTQSKLYKPEYKIYVLSALNAWSKALCGRLQYQFVDQKSQADITVQWLTSFQDKYMAGETTVMVEHSDIEIRTTDLPSKDIKSNIMHEFGHALGILAHSEQASDIMGTNHRWHRNDPQYEPKLSARDIQAIRLLYSSKWKVGENLYATAAQARPLLVTKETTAFPVCIR